MITINNTGKSMLAKQFAIKHAQENIWWFNVYDYEKYKNEKAYFKDKIAEKIKDDNLLIIFDGISNFEEAEEVLGYFNASNVKILFTTRNSNIFGNRFSEKSYSFVEVGNIPLKDAQKFMVKMNVDKPTVKQVISTKNISPYYLFSAFSYFNQSLLANVNDFDDYYSKSILHNIQDRNSAWLVVTHISVFINDFIPISLLSTLINNDSEFEKGVNYLISNSWLTLQRSPYKALRINATLYSALSEESLECVVEIRGKAKKVIGEFLSCRQGRMCEEIAQVREIKEELVGFR